MNRQRIAWNLAAFAAIGYLVAMVIVGALPQQRQLVKFEAKGVMQLAPDRIDRVELVRGNDKTVFLRTSETAWNQEGKGALPQPLAERLSMAVQFMNTSGPVREMAPAEYRSTDPREFGLERPQLSVTLFEKSAPVLRAHFGGRNPEDMLQYMTVDGRDTLYLMSRFVGQEWLAVADAAR